MNKTYKEEMAKREVKSLSFNDIIKMRSGLSRKINISTAKKMSKDLTKKRVPFGSILKATREVEVFDRIFYTNGKWDAAATELEFTEALKQSQKEM